MRIYFIRHGKDNPNYRGGWSQLDLTIEGVAQTLRLAEFLYGKQKEFRINRIISSDLVRAEHTATIINEKLGLNIDFCPKWREINNGELAGIKNSVAEANYKGLYFSSLQLDQKYPKGESPIEFSGRIKKAFEDLCKTINADENILLVTHSGVINIIYHIINNQEWTNKSKIYPIDHASIHLFEKVQDVCRIKEINLPSGGIH